LKIKPEERDLDLVITGGEYGTGKRSGWISSFILSCRDGNKFLEIGRVGTGFKEKKEEGDGIPKLPELPSLPELPELPETENNSGTQVSELPNFSSDSSDDKSRIPQLPSFPNDDMGNKFSQDTIKEAITGRKGVEEVGANDFEEEEMQMMPKPLTIRREEREIPTFENVREAEPIFIRVDKFEESSKAFEEIKKKVAEIEKTFTGIRKVKEEEDKELELWEKEIRQIKTKIEKIETNIFSRLM